MVKYGLIGKSLGHSFSMGYHNARFARIGLDAEYHNFEMETAAQIRTLFEADPDLLGVNVTVPYKTSVIQFLDGLDKLAVQVGAVNTVAKTPEGLIGFNTDVYGFKMSLKNWWDEPSGKALILGSGGASKAVLCALELLDIGCTTVSRSASPGQLGYAELDASVLSDHQLIVNCTPLGMTPHEEFSPDIPYSSLTTAHRVYDLVYNPEKTLFLKRAAERGAHIKNGLEMLHLQADKAWHIWQSYL